MRGAIHPARWATLLALVATVSLSPALVRAESTAGCAREVLDPYLATLQGWSVVAFKAGDGGARIVLALDGEAKYLLIALGMEGRKLHTFTSLHVAVGDATVPADVTAELNALWDRLWRDPAAESCGQLAVTVAPVGDEWYKELEVFYLTVQPKVETPVPGEEPDAPDDSYDLVATAILVFLIAVPVAALGLLVARIRRRRKGAGRN